MRPPRLLATAALAATLLFAGCADDDDPPTPTTEPTPNDTSPVDPSPGDPDESGASLDELAAICAEAGMVTVDRDIQAASTDVEIPDCEIHLEPGVGVEMADLSLTGGNLVFRADDTGTNLFELERISMDLESLTVQLDGPDDAFRAQRLSITTRDSIDVLVGAPGDNGEGGGTIHMIEVSLTTTGSDSAVRLATSQQAGTLRLERSSIDTPDTPRLSGAECVAEVNDEMAACVS